MIVTANKQLLLAGVAAVLAASAGATEAQTVRGALGQAGEAQSNFQRDRSVSVRQRPHEGYEALGIPFSAFVLWPKLSTTLEHNSNVYAASVNEQDDTVWHIAPELNVTSTWSRHSLQAYARANVHRFQDFSTENTEDYSVGAQGRVDVLRTEQLFAGVDWSKLTEPRTSSGSPTGSVEPIRYSQASAFLNGFKEFNRLRISGRADWRRLDYDSGRAPNGAEILQDDRDRTLWTVTGRADYAVSPDTALFVEVSGNTRNYKLSNPPATLYPRFVNRDSDGVQALVGANFELTALIRGELGVGYLSQKFDQAGLNDIDGLGARAQVEWFPTQLLTLTFTGSRSVEDAGVVASSGYLSSNLGVQADYELLRNVIVSAQASYGKDEYSGIDRDDKRFIAGLSATYLLNRHVGVTASYNHFEQTSKGTNGGNDFTVDRVGATVTLQY